MKEKILSMKNVISAVNGFKGKKIVGLRDTSDSGESETKHNWNTNLTENKAKAKEMCHLTHKTQLEC